VKTVNKFLAFIFLMAFAASCFDQPEFSTVPQIEFENICFRKDSNALFLTFNFQDGDGDIGIQKVAYDNNIVVDNTNAPFHPVNYFLEDGTGALQEVETNVIYIDTLRNNVLQLVPLTILDLDGKTGKLVTVNTRNKPNYGSLPLFDPKEINCIDYAYNAISPVYIRIENNSVIENKFNVQDTIVDIPSTTNPANTRRYLELGDTLYFEHNPNHYTIEVDFLEKTGNNTFTEFDWRKEFCTTYDGRISQLTGNEGPIDGTLTYKIQSSGLEGIFSVKTLKLRVKIRDRAFHESNVIETPEFTLNGRRCSN
jgi:hypothetical protein